MPENASVGLRQAVGPMIARLPLHVPGVAGVDQRIRQRLFAEDLRLLNDALAASPMAGRFWMWAGLLLGWAREGRPLRHDLRDADFAFAAQDEPALIAAEATLRAAGFMPGFRFRNNDGEVTEHTYVRHGARFDFFRMTPVADSWEYNVYGPDDGRCVELTARLPCQPFEDFDFLGRQWRKPVDHEEELRLLYGRWQEPDPGWSWLGQGGVVGWREWTGG